MTTIQIVVFIVLIFINFLFDFLLCYIKDHLNYRQILKISKIEKRITRILYTLMWAFIYYTIITHFK